MKFLVDANVLSEPTKTSPNPSVIDWLHGNMRHIAVDPVTLGEIQYGILLLQKGKRRAKLEEWFDTGVSRIQCLPFDAAMGIRWAQLLARLRNTGRAMPLKDSLIAATALTHGLTVATRNTTDFAMAGVDVFNPFVQDVASER